MRERREVTDRVKRCPVFMGDEDPSHSLLTSPRSDTEELMDGACDLTDEDLVMLESCDVDVEYGCEDPLIECEGVCIFIDDGNDEGGGDFEKDFVGTAGAEAGVGVEGEGRLRGTVGLRVASLSASCARVGLYDKSRLDPGRGVERMHMSSSSC